MHTAQTPIFDGPPDRPERGPRRRHTFGVAFASIGVALTYVILFVHPGSDRTTTLSLLAAIMISGCGALLAAQSTDTEQRDQ